MLDFNGAGEQRPDGLIPDGTYCLVKANIKPGQYTLPKSDPADMDLFTASKSSDVVMLNFEFTVLAGPHRARKFWQSMTISGGQLDEQGVSKGWKITKQTLKAILESASGIDPKDESEYAKSARMPNSFRDLDGIEFAAKIGIEFGDQYPDKNKIAHIVVPGEPEYEIVRAGGEVSPKPTSRPSSRGNAPLAQQGAFSWQAAPKPAAASSTAQGAWAQSQQPNGSAPAPAPQQTHQAGAQQGPSWLNNK